MHDFSRCRRHSAVGNRRRRIDARQQGSTPRQSKQGETPHDEQKTRKSMTAGRPPNPFLQTARRERPNPQFALPSLRQTSNSPTPPTLFNFFLDKDSGRTLQAKWLEVGGWSYTLLEGPLLFPRRASQSEGIVYPFLIIWFLINQV